MPSKSDKQKKLMAAACHNKEFAKSVDVPQDVACEFNAADKKKVKENLNLDEKSKRIFDAAINYISNFKTGVERQEALSKYADKFNVNLSELHSYIVQLTGSDYLSSVSEQTIKNMTLAEQMSILKAKIEEKLKK